MFISCPVRTKNILRSDKLSAEFMSVNLLERRIVYFFCVCWQMRFEKTPALVAHTGGEEILQTYLALNKLSAIKKSDQMCLQNVQ